MPDLVTHSGSDRIATEESVAGVSNQNAKGNEVRNVSEIDATANSKDENIAKEEAIESEVDPDKVNESDDLDEDKMMTRSLQMLQVLIL